MESRKITDQINIGKYTVLILNSSAPASWKKIVKIEKNNYESDIVYDFPNSIGILGSGDFKGKEVFFV